MRRRSTWPSSTASSSTTTPGRVAAAIGAIAQAPAGCIVVSCHAGKDRTGVVIALTLDLLGVPHELIAADYATAPPATGASSLPELAAPRAAPILDLLAHVHDRYGGSAAYLGRAGASADLSRSLARRLLSSGAHATSAPPIA